ncbi:hypothetical protein ABBQ32_000262 [Trebouxia sp. C0010 RCD-2024]
MVLRYGNLTECGVCLDSDFFDLWRSCGDCNISYTEPECRLSCDSCIAGEGEDTAEVPAPRADQQIAIPANGCSVRRRNYQLECDAQSEGACGVTPAPSRIGIGCQPCANSSFTNDCEGCLVLGCQVRCDSCLIANRSNGAPNPLTIPAGGCEVTNSNAKLICSPGTEGTCPLVPVPPRPTHFEGWKVAVAVTSGLVGFAVLTAIFAVLWWRHRNRERHFKNKLSELSRVEDLSTLPEKLVHASIISSKDVKLCKRPNGEDWLLGRGSYGTVYKARMGELYVAVKTIHREHVSPQLTAQEALRTIAKELTILEMIPFDKRVVQFYGSCNLNGKISLVLELMEGGDLNNALRMNLAAPELSWYNRGARIALDIIKGLHFLHSHNVQHRDIKSGNILLSQNYDSAKICDVGLARIMNNTSITSSSHNIRTTFTHAAPEIIMCKRSDQRADIFSYGVLLWELITQEQVPQRGEMRDFQIPEECPQAISDMVMACHSEKPDDRPTTQEIIRVIESSIADIEAGNNHQLQEGA